MSDLSLITLPLPAAAVLCYVDPPFAYFTTQPLAEQAGDDWDDAPYDCNAGPPYEPQEGQAWQVVRVAYEAELQTPAERSWPNCYLSVNTINRGETPWLCSPRWSERQVLIRAGARLDEFCRLITKAGGTFYLPARATS